MPKRVAIVDIGSNSARVVIYQRTSRFGFHLIAQKKANVRISEGSFEQDGILQDIAIKRTIEALHIFKTMINEYKARKTVAIATAAVRNAPNKNSFIRRVRNEVGLNIKVIDGNKEAFYGATAVKNLLPLNSNSITIDIGGGSTDIAFIEGKRVIDTISLNIGTITIKELFFDKNRPLSEAREYILSEVKKIPDDFLNAQKAVAIGGVLRALAKSIMLQTHYSYKKIHAFGYNYRQHSKHMERIINANNREHLDELFIKSSRYDTIRQGVLIFTTLVEYLDINTILTSGVGVREGLFLHDMLRGVGGVFPEELNPSIVSIQDRLDIIKIPKNRRIQIVKSLYKVLASKFDDKKEDYLKLLMDAIKISDSGKTLTIYNEHKHTYYIATQELNWQYTHKQMLLIAAILRSSPEKLLYKRLQRAHKELLPSKKTVRWLSFIYTLSSTLAIYNTLNNYNFYYKNRKLTICDRAQHPLLVEDIKSFELPKDFEITFHNETTTQ